MVIIESGSGISASAEEQLNINYNLAQWPYQIIAQSGHLGHLSSATALNDASSSKTPTCLAISNAPSALSPTSSFTTIAGATM